MFTALELQTVLVAIDQQRWRGSWRALVCVHMEYEARVLGGWIQPDDPVAISERIVTGYIGCSTRSARRWLQTLVGEGVLLVAEPGVGSRPTSYRVERNVSRWGLGFTCSPVELARRLERWQAMPKAEIVQSTKGKAVAMFAPSYARRHNGFVSASLYGDAQTGNGGGFVHPSMRERTNAASSSRRTISVDRSPSSREREGDRPTSAPSTPHARRVMAAIQQQSGNPVYGSMETRVNAVVTEANVEHLVAVVLGMTGPVIKSYVAAVEHAQDGPVIGAAASGPTPHSHRPFRVIDAEPAVIDLTSARDELAAARSRLTPTTNEGA